MAPPHRRPAPARLRAALVLAFSVATAAAAASEHVQCQANFHCAGSNCHSTSAFDARFCPDCSCASAEDARLATELCRIRSVSLAEASAHEGQPRTGAQDMLRAERLPPDDAQRPRHHCGTMEALLDGDYVAPCADCGRLSSCRLGQAKWQPRRCELRPGHSVSYPLLPPHATVIFLGDSTLRGMYEALLALAGQPPLPKEAQHANHSATLHDGVAALFRYYPPWEEIRQDAHVLSTFPTFQERFLPQPQDAAEGFVPQAADFLMQLKPLIAAQLRSSREARVLIVHGGIMLRQAWVNDVRLLEEAHALLPSPEDEGRLLHVFAANGPRSGNACGQYRGLTPALQAYLRQQQQPLAAAPGGGGVGGGGGGGGGGSGGGANRPDPFQDLLSRQARTMAWFPRCRLLDPLYPGLVRADKCQCHFHWSVGSSGRVAGPGVYEQLRVLLHAWRHDLFARGDGSGAVEAMQRLQSDTERFEMHELSAAGGVGGGR